MKNIHLLFSLSMLLSLTGCGGNASSTQQASSSSSNVEVSTSESSKESSKVNSSEVSSSIITSTSTVNLGDPNVVDLIIMAGQSNMEGHTWINKLIENTPKDMHDYYLNGFEDTLIMFHSNGGTHKNEEFEPVKVGMGFDKTRFGPEVGVAQRLQETGRKRPTYLVKYALGATSLYNDWKSPSAGAQNSLYRKMVDYVYDIILSFEEQDIEVKIKGLFWMQGEADSCLEVETNQYYENLEYFVNDFRYEFEDTYGDEERGIAFVDAGISDCSTWTYHEEVNAAKKQFAESDPSKNYYFDTMEEGLEYNKDNQDYFHFDATSEIKLGKLFIDTLLDNGWMDY